MPQNPETPANPPVELTCAEPGCNRPERREVYCLFHLRDQAVKRQHVNAARKEIATAAFNALLSSPLRAEREDWTYETYANEAVGAADALLFALRIRARGEET